MNSNFRFYVLTRFKAGIQPLQIVNELILSHGSSAPSQKTVYRWVDSIKSGTFQLLKNTRPESIDADFQKYAWGAVFSTEWGAFLGALGGK